MHTSKHKISYPVHRFDKKMDKISTGMRNEKFKIFEQCSNQKCFIFSDICAIIAHVNKLVDWDNFEHPTTSIIHFMVHLSWHSFDCEHLNIECDRYLVFFVCHLFFWIFRSMVKIQDSIEIPAQLWIHKHWCLHTNKNAFECGPIFNILFHP